MKYIVDHLPKGNVKRIGLPMTPEFLTWHNTGNPKSTARQEMVYLFSEYNTSTTGYHLVVDEKECYELIPLNEVAYHAGDGRNGPGNRRSIGLEVCESGNYEQTIQNAIEITVKWLRETGKDPEKAMKQHFDWSGKNCPRLIRAGYKGWTWTKILQEVKKQLMGDENKVPVVVNGELIHVTGKIIDGQNLVHIRPICEKAGLKVDFRDGITYIGGMDYPNPLAYVKDGLLIKETTAEDVSLRKETTTVYDAKAFDGINGVFFGNDMELLGAAYDRGTMYHTGEITRADGSLVPPRAALFALDNGLGVVQRTRNITAHNGLQGVLWAVGGLSSNAKDRLEEEAARGGIPEKVARPRTAIGFQRKKCFLITTYGQDLSLEAFEKKMDALGFERNQWIFLDGGGSTQAYFYNGGTPLYVKSSRKVPLLVQARRRT